MWVEHNFYAAVMQRAIAHKCTVQVDKFYNTYLGAM